MSDLYYFFWQDGRAKSKYFGPSLSMIGPKKNPYLCPTSKFDPVWAKSEMAYFY